MAKLIKQMLGMEHMPTAGEINDLLEKCRIIIKKIEKRCSKLKAAKTYFKSYTKDKVRLKDDSLDTDDWNKKSEDEKREVFQGLRGCLTKLKSVNKGLHFTGMIFFLVIVTLFVGSIILYLCLHKIDQEEALSKKEKVAASDIIALESHLTVMEKTLVDENMKGRFSATYGEVKKYLTKEPLGSEITFGLWKAYGKLGGEIELNKVNRETFENFRKKLEAEIKSLNTRYFWLGTPGRWFELAFWSFWGVIVGILFYMAGLFDTGIFPTEKIPMFLTEIFITPLVVIAIFLLFPFTGLDSFAPSESSIYISLGIAFIFGFSIRRTVGLLDNIKRRIFPDPEPAGKEK